MENLRGLDFDFHFRVILKTYAGDANMFGIDYFDALIRYLKSDL